MAWSPLMLQRIGVVRDLRMRMAEVNLMREERELEALRDAETQRRQDLLDTQARSQDAARQADQALVGSTTGGRSGITQWTLDRQQVRRVVTQAHALVEDAAVAQVRQREVCAEARLQWRATRFDVERLRLLAEAAGDQRD